MNRAEIEQELSDLFDMAYVRREPSKLDTTFASLGLDSMDMLELMLVIEERWPVLEGEDYDLSSENTIQDVADKICEALGIE